MEQKLRENMSRGCATQSERKSMLWSGGGDMKRSASELALEEVLMKVSDSFKEDKLLPDFDAFFADFSPADLPFPSRNRDLMTGNLSSKNYIPSQPSVAVTVDSQSSFCVGSPVSANKSESRDNQARGATSGSSHEQSDDEDIEIEAGPCEQSTDPIDIKRIRRMVSNRESARRSRKRKQAHLADLELQVDQLRGENGSLYKQLTDASQQYRDADTNNRVLKSDVEALRAKVKLAEDMVTRGSLTCSLNQLLQSHLTSPPALSTHNLRRVPNVSPTITVNGDNASYAGLSGQNPALGLGNVDIGCANLNHGIVSDSVSCVTEIWPTLSN